MAYIIVDIISKPKDLTPYLFENLINMMTRRNLKEALGWRKLSTVV